jgi:hypothetical protein
MHGGDKVYSRERVYSRVPGDIAHRAHRAHSVDATDAFMLGGAMMAFVIGSLAWWLLALRGAVRAEPAQQAQAVPLRPQRRGALRSARPTNSRGARLDVEIDLWRRAPKSAPSFNRILKSFSIKSFFEVYVSTKAFPVSQ